MFEYFFNICLEINRIRISCSYSLSSAKKGKYGNINILGMSLMYY